MVCGRRFCNFGVRLYIGRSMQSVPAATIRADTLPVALGMLFIAIGLLAMGVRILRRRGDWSLLFFGIASTLYGLRLIVLSGTAHVLFGDVVTTRIEWTITFLIGIPFVLYFSSSVLPVWRRAVWITVALQCSLAAFGIPAAYTGVGFATAKQLNNVLVVVFMPVLFLLVYLGPSRVDRNVSILKFGAIIFAAFSIYTNVAGLGFLPGSTRLEPIGFVIFLGCLGYVSANRAIRNEERLVSIQSELELARRIQAGLLPSGQRTDSRLHISAKYVPLSSVAGDFYDFLQKDGGTGVLIADVTGHGVPAALTASMVKVAIRAQTDHASDPSKVLAGLNTILHGNLQGQFVTAAYVYFAPEMSRLVYSGAGHPPILVWRALQRNVEVLESNGLFLGPFPTVEYPALETTFVTGDRCLLYTDGILEAETPSGDAFGQEQLAKYCAEHAGLDGDAFCRGLLNRVRDWSQLKPEHEQNDDITIVLVDCV